MRKWLSGKLFDLAVWLSWEEVLKGAKIIVIMDGIWSALPTEPPKKIGRPLGSKDKNPRNTKRMGRPKGSKNKPKVQP